MLLLEFFYSLFSYFHFSHVEYVKDGLKHMRLKFYIEGSEPGLKGTVHSESKEVSLYLNGNLLFLVWIF